MDSRLMLCDNKVLAKPLKKRRNLKGQASIMIAMMMLTFILFFAFVVNTGMLVHAKINLQNAADLAAYAGAAVQARQLNQISYLNYEMRRQYKKFLFRYYVMGNSATEPFPRADTDSGRMLWSPDGNFDYQVPSVCVIFNSQDNYCHIKNLPKITIPPENPLDQINSTLIGQLKAIENIRQKNCLSIGKTNIQVLLLWLYNTDPSLSNLPGALAGAQDMAEITRVIKGLGQGLGLLPSEFILRQRIKTLSGYINDAPRLKVTKDLADGFSKSADPASKERTVEAFYSAYYTLGSHLWVDDSNDPIQMAELLPSGGEGANLIRLQDIKQRFDTYAVDYVGSNGGELNEKNPGGTKETDCEPRLAPFTIPQPLTLGVYKDPKVLTYYAVKLEATARLLFSPLGNLRLKAYAAAQPFGSRIGPQSDGSNWVRAEANPNPNVAPQSFNLAGQVPNLPIKEAEGTATGQGWDNRKVVGTFYAKFKPPGSTGLLQLIDAEAIKRATHAAMAPNPWEGNKYNIPNDLGQDQFIKNFDSNRQLAFWAPILPPDKSGNTDEIKKAVTDFFAPVPGTAAKSDPNIASSLSNALIQGVNNYMGALRQQQGENGDGFNVVRIRDPISVIPDGNGSSVAQITGDPEIFLSDPKKIKTSWVATNDSNITEAGRVGYSVKFVAFDSLLGKRNPSNGQETWENVMDIDASGSREDLSSPFFKH